MAQKKITKLISNPQDKRTSRQTKRLVSELEQYFDKPEIYKALNIDSKEWKKIKKGVESGDFYGIDLNLYLLEKTASLFGRGKSKKDLEFKKSLKELDKDINRTAKEANKQGLLTKKELKKIVKPAPKAKTKKTSKPVQGKKSKPVQGKKSKPVQGKKSKPVQGKKSKPVQGESVKDVFLEPVTRKRSGAYFWSDEAELKKQIPQARTVKTFSDYKQAEKWWKGISGGSGYFVLSARKNKKSGQTVYTVVDIRTENERTNKKGNLNGIARAKEIVLKNTESRNDNN